VTLYRCFAWDRRAAPVEPGGALWFARAFQGDGRHDNPERYGCLYAAEETVSAVAEQLARFRGNVDRRHAEAARTAARAGVEPERAAPRRSRPAERARRAGPPAVARRDPAPRPDPAASAVDLHGERTESAGGPVESLWGTQRFRARGVNCGSPGDRAA
jgi:hypothetical protein